MRNNEDRLGAVAGGSTPPVQQVQQTEQPLQFVTPTEFVELPSKGKYYSEGHPLHNQDTIEIRHMTAKDEDTLTSAALLKKGIAIERFLQNIIVDRRIKVSDLLIGDKNAVVIASRITGYGADYQTSVTCPSCGSNVQNSFDLEACEVNEIPDYSELGVTPTIDGTFMVHLDSMNVDVEVKLLTGKDENMLSQLSQRKRKKKLPETPLTDQMKQLIVSVDGNDSPEYINSFIEHMPAGVSRKFRTIYSKIIPNINMNQYFVCDSCGHEGEVSVPFGANFFWPKQ